MSTIKLGPPKQIGIGSVMQELFQNHQPGVIYEFLIRKDASRSFIYVSDNCEEILGIASDALLKDSNLLKKLIYNEDLPAFEQSLNQSHAQHAPWNWEGRILHNGTIRWIETRSSALVKGEDVLRKGIIIDITDRKQREQESELRYQMLIEHLPLGVGIHIGGELVFANAYAHKILKAKPGELIGRNVLEFVHPDFRDFVFSRMQRAHEGETLPPTEERFICLNSEVIDVETVALPFTYKGAAAVQIIVRDITEQKRAQEAIKKNETFFTNLFDNIPVAVVKLDETGKVELINKGFSEMFGYHLNELRGKNLNDFIVPSELGNEGINLNNLITDNKVIKVETIRKNKEGLKVDVILYGMPVIMESRAIGIYGVYVDITDRKNIEEELRIRNAELDNFVYKVSHDLRAPLSSVLGLVNLARLPGNTDDPRQYIDIIGEKVADLDHFIGDVLSHSKNLKMEVTVEPINFAAVLERTIEDLNYLQGASDVEFNTQINGDSFYSDPWRVSEIFRNLVSNAIKYRQFNGAKPSVDVSIDFTDAAANIRFTDNGIGISDESRERIFEMFYRATEQSDGSGIGLYIVKNAVDKLGGNIRVMSKLGEGTTFIIELPNRKKFL